jgi:hypothetical protein
VIHVGIEQREIERYTPGAWQSAVIVRAGALDVKLTPALDEISASDHRINRNGASAARFRTVL